MLTAARALVQPPPMILSRTTTVTKAATEGMREGTAAGESVRVLVSLGLTHEGHGKRHTMLLRLGSKLLRLGSKLVLLLLFSFVWAAVGRRFFEGGDALPFLLSSGHSLRSGVRAHP